MKPLVWLLLCDLSSVVSVISPVDPSLVVERFLDAVFPQSKAVSFRPTEKSHHGENDFVASTKRFVNIATANHNCRADNYTCSGDNCNCCGGISYCCNNWNWHRSNFGLQRLYKQNVLLRQQTLFLRESEVVSVAPAQQTVGSSLYISVRRVAYALPDVYRSLLAFSLFRQISVLYQFPCLVCLDWRDCLIANSFS